MVKPVLGRVPKDVLRHVPGMHMRSYVLKHIPDYVLKRIAKTVLMTYPERTTDRHVLGTVPKHMPQKRLHKP